MSASLEILYRKFAKECSLLDFTFQYTVGLSRNQAIEDSCSHFTQEMCVIRLHDAWNRFCRELVVSSAGSKPTTSSGIRLSRSPGINKYSDVIAILIRTYRKRINEPFWHSPSESIDAVSRLHVANYSSIFQGLSLSFNGPNPTTQLTGIRNYFAHRNRQTSQKVISIAQTITPKPLNLASDLLSFNIQPGMTLFSLWIIRLKQMAQLAIQ